MIGLAKRIGPERRVARKMLIRSLSCKNIRDATSTNGSMLSVRRDYSPVITTLIP
jgi:hypothetical protein